MREPRFYIDQPISANAPISVRDSRAHYLRDVLRLRDGGRLKLFNGDGTEWSSRVLTTTKREVTLLAESVSQVDKTTMFNVHLGVGLSRGERMDWLVQKSTELGVSSIQPLLLNRCNARPAGNRVDNRLRHWHSVAIAACEQCGRNRLPVLHSPTGLSEWLQRCRSPLRLVMVPESNANAELSSRIEALDLLVGPEGGLDESELAVAIDSGFQPWKLGPRILRTETAPVAALAILQYCLGDLRA